MNPIFFLFQCLLSLLLCYASLVSIYISFFKNKQNDFLTWFFVLTLLLLTGILIKHTFVQFKELNREDFFSKKLNKIITLCLISLLIGFFNIYTQYYRGIENPELGQFKMSASGNSIEASYRQQQPPLDYYFSAFSHSLFGESKWAVRFHTMLFYLILSLILPLGLWFFCSSLWVTATGTVLFLFNHVIRLHAVDARPLNLALLTGFIFLFFYISSCGNSQHRRQSFLPILASQYLFVLSIGLQPVIFILSLFASSFWLLFDNKKEIFKKLFLSNVVTGILVFPFYIKMWLFGRSAYKFQKISFETINSYIENLNIFYFIEKYFFSFYKQMAFIFLIILSSLIFVGVLRKTITKRTLILISTLVLFPIFYDPVFNIGLIWNGFSNWYIITFSLFLILFAVLSLKEINEFLIMKKWKWFFLIPFSIIFLWNLYFQMLSIKNKTQFYFPYRDNSVKMVYDYLKKNGDPEDIAIEFTLTPVVLYRTDYMNLRRELFYDPNFHPEISNFYVEFTKTPPFFYESTDDKIYYINWKNIKTKINHKIFFIVFKASYKAGYNDEAYNVLSSFMKGHRVGKYVVFQHIVSGKTREKEYKQFLSKVNKKTPKKYRGVLYESLLYYAYQNQNRVKFKHLLQKYREMETALDEFIPDFNYPSRFELRRRVKYFENLDWNADNQFSEEEE